MNINQADSCFHGLVTDQPACRYWAFQGIETGVFWAFQGIETGVFAVISLIVTAVVLYRRGG